VDFKSVTSHLSHENQIILLPGQILSAELIPENEIEKNLHENISELQNWMTEDQTIITSLKLTRDTQEYYATILISKNRVQSFPQCHPDGKCIGSGSPPVIYDLNSARICVLTDTDILYPEMMLFLYLNNVDAVYIPSCYQFLDVDCTGLQSSVVWTLEEIILLWKSRSKDITINVFTSNLSGCGIASVWEGYSVDTTEISTTAGIVYKSFCADTKYTKPDYRATILLSDNDMNVLFECA